MTYQHTLKVALVVDDTLDSTDGVQQVMLTLGAWLTDQGHQVHYITSSTSRTDIGVVHSVAKNMRFKFNGNRVGIPLPANRKQLKHILATHDYDVVHVAIPHSPLLAGQLIGLLPKKTALVGTFMILPLSRASRVGGKILGWWQRPQIRRFDRLISPTPPASDFSRYMYGRPAIPAGNPVDTRPFNQARQAQLERSASTAETGPAILFLGRLVERKGAGALLKAVARVRELTPHPFTVEIAGTGPLRGEYEEYVAQHDLGEIVKFTGFIEEEQKAALLASAQIIALPAFGGESFGISVVEALAAGTGSVLVGDNPGYSSVIGPLTDCLVDPLDTESFAQTLRKHIEDPQLRERMSQAQVERAEAFNSDVVGNKVLRIYYEALAHRAARTKA